jgi:arylsulfatase A-like enzyme
MLLKIPGVTARRISWPASLVDFAPTLLHVLDLPGKADFLRQVTGIDRFDSSVVHADSRILGQSSPRQSASAEIGYSLRADRWKLHVNESGEASLYDLTDDPFELEDLANERERVVTKLRAELEGMILVQRRDVRTMEASDDVKADMKALGYGGDR